MSEIPPDKIYEVITHPCPNFEGGLIISDEIMESNQSSAS